MAGFYSIGWSGIFVFDDTKADITHNVPSVSDVRYVYQRSRGVSALSEVHILRKSFCAASRHRRPNLVLRSAMPGRQSCGPIIYFVSTLAGQAGGEGVRTIFWNSEIPLIWLHLHSQNAGNLDGFTPLIVEICRYSIHIYRPIVKVGCEKLGCEPMVIKR